MVRCYGLRQGEDNVVATYGQLGHIGNLYQYLRVCLREQLVEPECDRERVSGRERVGERAREERLREKSERWVPTGRLPTETVKISGSSSSMR